MPSDTLRKSLNVTQFLDVRAAMCQDVGTIDQNKPTSGDANVSAESDCPSLFYRGAT